MDQLDQVIAVTLKPTEKFLSWLNALPTSDHKLTLDSIRTDSSLYLLPQFETNFETSDFIKDYFLDLFEQEFNSWEEDHTLWPSDQTFENFLEMFDLEFHTMIYDLADDA